MNGEIDYYSLNLIHYDYNKVDLGGHVVSNTTYIATNWSAEVIEVKWLYLFLSLLFFYLFRLPFID